MSANSNETFLQNSGTLFLVSTPIGNLEDITYRAIRILKNVVLIAAEDTRTSGVLMQHYDIETSLTSYHDFNKEKVTPSLLEKLQNNQSIALITDAGTPGISDPAFYFVREAVQNGIKVESIPGPTAAISALVGSGLPTDRFTFEGFLPPKKGRQTRLKELAIDPRTIIIYESPKRIIKTLKDLYEYLGERQVVLARELTKKFEEYVRGNLSELLAQEADLVLKGEFVIVVEGLTKQRKREMKEKSREF